MRFNNDRLYEQYRNSREGARASRTLDVAWRTVVLVVGSSILGLGVFFIVFPGPGWATIWVGLLVLATEFRWAGRLLSPLQSAMGSMSQIARNPKHQQRRMNILLAVTMVAVFASYLYIALYGVSLDGLFALRQWFRGLW